MKYFAELQRKFEEMPYGIKRKESPLSWWQRLLKKREKRPENLYSPFEENWTQRPM
jgi:hypothetical protein